MNQLFKRITSKAQSNTHARVYSQIAIYILLFIVTLFFIFSYRDSEAVRYLVNFEPENFTYNFDGMSFLKTYYTMKNGVSYYEANYIGVANDARRILIPVYVTAWRLPTLFSVWSHVARTGQDIWFIFIALSMVALWASYDIAAFLSNRILAFITPIFLVSYYYFSAISTQFLLVEWWAVSFFLVGMAFFLHKKLKTAVVLLWVAAAIREIYVLPLLIGLFLSIVYGKTRYFRYFVGALVIFTLFYLVHYLKADALLFRFRAIHLQFAGQPVGSGGIGFLRRTLAYGTQYFVTSKFGIQLLSVALLLTGLSSFSILVKKKSFEIQLCFGVLLSFVVLLLFFGASDNDYWGLFYVPLLLSIFPAAIHQILVYLMHIARLIKKRISLNTL